MILFLYIEVNTILKVNNGNTSIVISKEAALGFITSTSAPVDIAKGLTIALDRNRNNFGWR